jgi:hypothetical protein
MIRYFARAVLVLAWKVVVMMMMMMMMAEGSAVWSVVVDSVVCVCE